MNDVTHDVIIVGGGPGGLTAAIYTSREGLDTLVLEKMVCGGLVASTGWIENWPGVPEGISGMDLTEKFKQHAQKFGTKITENAEVTKVESLGKTVRVETTDGRYTARAVIVVSGSLPKKLNIPGEDKFYSKGVSYCATCDGPFYKDKNVAVIGCGDSGLQEGESLLGFVKSATFIEFLPQMRAEKILQERVKAKPNTEFLLNHMLTSINGDDRVRSVTVKNRQTNEESTLEVEGVFIYIGFLPNSKFMEGVVELDPAGYIISNEDMQTSVPGIYAAGDVRSKKVRQIDTACGEGTIAAISASGYIRQLT